MSCISVVLYLDSFHLKYAVVLRSMWTVGDTLSDACCKWQRNSCGILFTLLCMHFTW